MKEKAIVNFIFELGHLKRIKHEGWRFAGVDAPDSVADHSLRAAQIGYFLAKMEGYDDPREVCAMMVFHDIGECRIGDIHKVAARYVFADEKQAVAEQTGPLEETGREIFDFWENVEEKKTEAGVIAKDADMLEQAFMAKEYMERGYCARGWIDNISGKIETPSAKKLLDLLCRTDSHDWWQGLRKL